MNEEIAKKRRENWFEVMFTIEALAVEKEVVEKSLRTHVEKMGKIREIFIYDRQFLETLEVEKPLKNVERAYSQIAKLKFFAKDLTTLFGVVMVYGPSSIEILGPAKQEVKLDEVQNLANLIAGVVHQFAAAGVGGMVIAPDK
jgi:hypothetical protein